MPDPKYKPITKTKPFIDPEHLLGQLDITQGTIIADFGCGSGYFTFPAARLVGEGGIVYAVDIQKTVLSGIESKMKFLGIRNVKPIWANLEIVGSTKIEAETVEVVLLLKVLYQSKKHKEIFEECKRVLKPGGRLVVLDWEKKEVPLGPPLSLRVGKERAKSEAQSLGFKFVGSLDTDPYHWGLLFCKE